MRFKMNFKGFIDTTLRDGAASPLLYDTYKYRFSLEEKKQIVNALVKLGVRYFEFFSPVVSQQEAADFQQLKEYIQSLTKDKVYLLAHCRCHLQDIEAALQAGFNGLNLYMGLSSQAQQNYGKSLKDLLKLIKKTITGVRQKHPRLWLRYSGEDAFQTPLKNLFLVYDQIASLVNVLGTPDTTGTAEPEKVRQRIQALKKRYPKNYLEVHFHNDRGLVMANTLEAVKSGAEFVDSTIWGMAERSGITSITAGLLNLYDLDPKLVKNYDLSLCYPVNVLMASILKWHVPWTEPISLTNRTHIAGVHQKAVLGQTGYEAHNLEKFGVTKQQLLLGPLSGWNFVYYYLKEVENYLITPQEAKVISQEFKDKANKMGEKIKPAQLLNQIAQKYSLVRITVPEKYQDRRVEDLS